MTEIKFGWKPDLQSDKDYNFSDVKDGLTRLSVSTVDQFIINEKVPVYTQESLSSCVANATIGALEILLTASGNWKALSRLFVYWNARMYSKETDKDAGTYIRDAFKSLSTLGVCLESAWSYDVSKVFAQPPLEAYKEGNDNIIDSFYRISTYGNERLNDIEIAIRANHPVVFGTGVSKAFTQDFSQFGSSTVWGIPSDTVGGHAMVIVGVRRNADGTRNFYVRNSWGDTWGRAGHAWFDESYITWDQTTDIWVPTLVPVLTV